MMMIRVVGSPERIEAQDCHDSGHTSCLFESPPKSLEEIAG